MDMIELLVYMVVAMIAGALVFGVVAGTDFIKLKHDIDDELQGDDISFTMSEAEFVEKIAWFWDDCGLGTVDKEYAVYVTGEGNVSVEEQWSGVVRVNKDSVLRQQDLNTMVIDLPSIVGISCADDKLNIVSGN